KRQIMNKTDESDSTWLAKIREAWQWRLLQDRELVKRRSWGYILKVALAICLHLNRKTGWAFPGIATIAKRARALNRTTVMNAIKGITDHGYLQGTRAMGKNGRAVNQYRPIVADRVSQASPEQPISAEQSKKERRAGKAGSRISPNWQPADEDWEFAR